ncbi:Hexaprenyldihydroxybenzoate methyltransferase, mitochondrial [Tilletia horrida]|nr:Hexaprenyldihydroxybenzoate methyltransferase, mitochondrial [Tilletia horrida]
MNPVRIEFMRSKMEEVRLWDDALRAAAARRRVHTADSSSSSSSSSKGKQRAQEDEQETRPRASFLHDLDVLDVGCGGGFLSESLTRLGARTLGIDAASSNINIARAHAALDPALTPHPSRPSSLTYRDCTAEVLRHEGAQFDVVCAMEVVEHVRNPADFLRTLGALLKPGGHLFLSTIARTPVAHFLTIAMAEHILRLVSPGTHTYTQYIKPAEMLDFFKKSPANGGLGWLEQHQAASENQAVPDRLRYEIRGTAYLPWKSAWQLADRNASPAWSQLANYFFWARKPFDP